MERTDEKAQVAAFADAPGGAIRMNGAHAIIRSLEDEGVSYLFGYPGGQALALYDALYDSRKLTHILVRHEQGAVHAADGYARATGKPGIAIVTSGPGATNTITGIACAYMDSVPLIVITGQVETSVIGTDAFQETDITGVTLPITKHSYLVKDTQDLPRVIHEAFHIATTGRPGPVVIDVPSDIAAGSIDYRPCTTIELPSYKPTIKGNARQVKQAADLLVHAQRPLLLVGGGIVASGATDRLRMLASCLHAPVATTLMGKGAFPEDDARALGVAGVYGRPSANAAIADADVILAIGVRFSDRVTGPVEGFAPDAHIIHIDIDPAEIGKNVVPEVPIVGDADTVIGQLIERLGKAADMPDTSDWLRGAAELRAQDVPPCFVDGRAVRAGIAVHQVMRTLNGLLAERESIVTTEVGQHQMWASQFLTRSQPRTFLTSGGLGAMGFGLPAAIGAQLGCPDRSVVCVAGDGSIQMNVQEMATATANGLPIKVIVLDNAGLGMVRQLQEETYGSRYSQTVLPACPDFVKLAEAYGWQGARVSDADALDDALARLLASEGPALLDVVIDPDEFVFSQMEEAYASDSDTGRKE